MPARPSTRHCVNRRSGIPLRRNNKQGGEFDGIRTIIARRRFILSSLALASASVVTAPSVAQTRKLGDRPIRIVVPFAAGGGVDVFARLISEKLRQKNGLTIVVENRAGANGSIGGNAVKNAEPDGTTLLFSAGTHVMARQVMKKRALRSDRRFRRDRACRRGADDAGRVAQGCAEQRRRAHRRSAQGSGQMDICDRRRSARPAIWRSSNSTASRG